MPRYILPNGKAVYSEKAIPDDQLDDFMSSMMSEDSPTPAPAEKGMLQKWDEMWFNKPLSHKLTGGESLAPKVSNAIDDPAARTEDQWKIPDWVPIAGGGTLRSLGAGMLEGATGVLEGFTSPLNLATMGTAGVYGQAAKTATTLPSIAKAAYTTAPKVAEVARRTTQALSAPMTISGAARANRGFQGGEDYTGETNWQDVGFGLAEMAGGIAGTRLPRATDRVNPVIDPRNPIPENIPANLDTDIIDVPDPLNPANDAQFGVAPPPQPIRDTGMMEPFPNTIQRPPTGWPSSNRVTNASGDSAASVEALNRQSGMQSRGEQFGVYDRAGNFRPLIGPEAVDYNPRPGETYGVMGPNGFQVLNDAGGKVTLQQTPKLTGIDTTPDTFDLGEINLDPNMNQGMGNPELAGSIPYNPADLAPPTNAGIPKFGMRSGGEVDPLTGELIEGPILGLPKESVLPDEPPTPIDREGPIEPTHEELMVRLRADNAYVPPSGPSLLGIPEGRAIDTPQTPEILPHADDIYQHMGDNNSLPGNTREAKRDAHNVILREAATKWTDDELIAAANDLNRDTLTRKMSGAAVLPDKMNKRRIVETELIRRGINAPLVAEPFVGENRPRPMTLDPMERGLFDQLNQKQLPESPTETSGGITGWLENLVKDDTGSARMPEGLSRWSERTNEPVGEVIDGSNMQDPWILDTARMADEAARRNRSYDPVREADVRQWNERQRANAEYEGNFNKPNTHEYSRKDSTNYTPDQLAVKASYDRMQAYKDEFSRWFHEQENQLPEGEYFTPPPDVQAKYDAGLAKLVETHERNVSRLQNRVQRSPESTILEGEVVKSDAPSIGSRIRGFLKDEEGSFDPDAIPDRLKALYEKHVKGGLTPEEIVEAKSLAAQAEVKATTQKATTPTVGQLPPDLRGAKPRFNMGKTSYEPVFANDLDKALFIIGQKTASKRDADYLAFVMKQTGLDEAGARAAAADVRAKIKAGVAGQPEGQVKLKPLYGAPAEAAKNTSKPTLNTAAKGTTIKIQQSSAKPEAIKAVKEAGFEFEGLDDKGNFIFKKTNDGGSAPILESEVGESRPTRAKVNEGLGPLADKKKGSAFSELYHFGRTTMASMDFSAPLRQGIALIHKPGFRKALVPMFKAWASESNFRASQEALANRPLFRKRAGPDGKVLPSFADDAGLKLTDLTDMTKREEAIMSEWAEKIPGVRRSNRAYTAFLNHLRADVFESLVKDGKVFGADAKANLPLARELANFVNTASGRGSLGKLDQSAVALSHLFFAPRLIASRVQMLNPHYYITANPMVRKEALKSLFAIAAAGNTITQLGRLAGGTVGSDPSSSDFGKLKIGDTRIDPYGGFQQYIVAANRLLNPMGPATGFEGDTPFTRGQMVTSSTSENEYNLWENDPGPYDPDSATVGARFLRGKVHPVIAFAWSLFSGRKEMSGETMNLSTLNPMENAIAQRFIPILLQDLYELSQEEDMPPALKALVATTSTFGMGSQTYGGNEDFDLSYDQ